MNMPAKLAVSFNNQFISFADNETFYLFPVLSDDAKKLMTNRDVQKIGSKPHIKILSLFGKCENYDTLSNYLQVRPDLIYPAKQELVSLGNIDDYQLQAKLTSQTILKYMTIRDQSVPDSTTYLDYLTIFNNILSTYGPLNLIDLVRLSRQYIHNKPVVILDHLIKIGALSIDLKDTVVSIPDQPPLLSHTKINS